MKHTIAVALAAMLAGTAQTGAAEEWSPFAFFEQIDPITDAVTWTAAASSATGGLVAVECGSDEPGVAMIFSDRAIRSRGHDIAMLAVRFDKDTPMEFVALNPTGRAVYVVLGRSGYIVFPGADYMFDHPGYLNAPKILDGLRTKTTMAFRISGGTPVILPLTGLAAAMAQLDAKCPLLAVGR